MHRKSRKSGVAVAVAMTAGAMLPLESRAEFQWTGTTNNNWNLDTNWLQDGNPLPAGTYPDAAGACR
jgi:hypothetical protein